MSSNRNQDSFDPSKRYSGLKMQPGRVQRDDDWNTPTGGAGASSPRRWKWFAAGLILLGALAVLLLGLLALYSWYRQEQTRARFEPPTVLVAEPLSGSSAFVGSHVSVNATAFGRNPIIRVELWWDGELKETLASRSPAGDLTLYAHFDLLMTDGQHTITVRAVNDAAMIGQSLPVSLVGTPKPGPGTLAYVVPAKAGETLADIGKQYGSDPAAMDNANPDLAGQPLADGTQVQVPVPPETQPGPTAPPAPPPGGSPAPPPEIPPLKEAAPPTILVSGILTALLFPPAAPTGLQGQVTGCDVMLHWNDNAANETRYEVWTAWMGMSPRLVASLEPSATKGPAWYKFRAPQSGWVPFWVEAVNAAGSQPSNTITLQIDPQKCEWSKGSGQYLIVQVYDMTVGGGVDRVYCYVSYEAVPEQRIPESAGNFIAVKGGKAGFDGAPVGKQVSGPNSKLIPVPQDGSLDVEGRCLGWAGQTLKDLGPFAGKYAQIDWDGARRTIKSAGYQVEFAITPWTPAVEAAAQGRYWYEDPTLPAPWGLVLNEAAGGGKPDPRDRLLNWNWDGDPKKITGFQVFLEGLPYAYFEGANTRQAKVMNPVYCGHIVRWSVAAVAGHAQSPRSKALEFNPPSCHAFATVKFDYIEFNWTQDGIGSGGPGDCDTLEAYWGIAAHLERRGQAGKYPTYGPTIFNQPGVFVTPIRCGTYIFGELLSHSSIIQPDTFVVPLEKEEIDIPFWFEAWDVDVIPGVDDDPIARHHNEFKFPSLQIARDQLGCSKQFTTDWKAESESLSRLTYTLAVYPNACLDFPVGVPLPKAPWAP